MPTQADMLGNLDQANKHLFEVARQALNVDMSQVVDPQHRSEIIGQLKQMGYDVGNVGNTITEGANNIENTAKEIENATGGQTASNVPPIISGRKIFNLKTAQMSGGEGGPAGGLASPVNTPGPMQATSPASAAPMEAPMPENPAGSPPAQGATDPMSNMQFEDGSDVKAWLEEIGDPNQAIQTLSDKFSNSNSVVTDPQSQHSSEALSVIKDAVNEFYSTNDEQSKLDAASTLFEMIMPDGAKTNQPVADDAVPSQLERVNIANVVKETNNVIRKLAEASAASSKKTIFNLKTAQHKTLENVIVLGPNDHIDQFTGQLINDWHLVERNKGFGLKIDGVLNLDFEKVWRENIMDKYTLDYIEKRFEVDSVVPPLSNYSLAPGETRRITPPEYSHTEARLEANRAKMNKDRGYSPSEKGEPFNWKKASSNVCNCGCPNCKSGCDGSCCKKKVAQVQNNSPSDGIKPLKDPFKMPGEKTLRTETLKKCPQCNGDLSDGSPNWCPNCHVTFGTPQSGEVRNTPNMPGTPGIQQKPTIIQPNQRMASMRDASTGFDGIFWDGSNFVCYAQQQSHRFHTFDEAEKFKAMKADPQEDPTGYLDDEKEQEPENFKQLPASPQVNPATLLQKQQLMQHIPSDPHSTVQDCHHVADNLGIEG